MPLLLLCGVLALAAQIEALLAGGFDVGGGRPDLVLALVVTWSLARGGAEGVLAGLVGGAFLGTFSAVPLGMHSLVLAALGFLTGLGEANLYRGNLPLIVSTAVLTTVAYHGAIYLGLQALGWALPDLAAFVRGVAPAAVLNALLMAPLFRVTTQLAKLGQPTRQIEL